MGDAIIFTDSTNSMDGLTLQWNWNLGDGTIRNTKNVTHTYSSQQTYNVSLFTVNSHGCNSDTLYKLITVYPYPTVNAGPDRFMLQGGVITIQATSTGANLQYLWSPPLYLNDRYIIKPKAVDPKNISDEELWALRYTLRRKLVEFSRFRLHRQILKVYLKAPLFRENI